MSPDVGGTREYGESLDDLFVHSFLTCFQGLQNAIEVVISSKMTLRSFVNPLTFGPWAVS